MLTAGNTAKLYCLEIIDDTLARRKERVEILDLGCGEAQAFVELLRKHPHAAYVGVEPDARACVRARERLSDLDATILNADAYAIHRELGRRFLVVTSFSALEHVYRRRAYLEAARESLHPEGTFFINYDAGHFTHGRERLRNLVGPFLAPLGIERYYQSFVSERSFRNLIEELGFEIRDAKFFNSPLKGIYKNLPDADKDAFMKRWCELELWLNETGLEYRDEHAGLFGTRNFLLGLKAGRGGGASSGG